MNEQDTPPEIHLVVATNSRRTHTRTGDEKVPCEICAKLVGSIRQHRRDAHGIKSGRKRRTA